MKKFIKICMTVLCVCLFTLGFSSIVHAASYKTAELYNATPKIGNAVFSTSSYHNGGYTLYATVSGKRYVITDYLCSMQIVSNGSKVYYTERKGSTVSFCRSSVKGTTKKTFKSYSPADYIGIAKLYQKKIYYVVDIDPGTLYSFDLSTGKVKKVATNVTSMLQKGKYFYLLPYMGDDAPSWIMRVLNPANGKVTTISKRLVGYECGKTYFTYVEQPSGSLYSTGTRTVRIKRYTLSTGKTKTLVSGLKVRKIKKVTSKYVTYVDANGKTVKKTL